MAEALATSDAYVEANYHAVMSALALSTGMRFIGEIVHCAIS